MAQKTIEIRDLKTHFFTRRGLVKAVDGVNFSVGKGETLGLVGESGSGKSITCLSILKLVPQPAGKIVGGEILLNGVDLVPKTEKEMRQIRGGKISMILQEPMTSLNPVYTIADQVGEPIRLHQKLNRKGVFEKVKEMLTLVKIPSPEVRMKSYPHQMSGGMRQRIMGAMMLSCQPDLLIADEPTTALDVTIQAQFLELIKGIQRDFNLSMIMVTHDFGIVAKACDLVAVMYAGQIVENAPIMEIFDNPQHPYTQALMNSLPKIEEKAHRLYSIAGQPPDLADLPRGCNFLPRCPEAMEKCFQESPPRSEVREGHFVSCWLNDGQTS
jgi:oligopeptide/dipeptide ABC transporter ATP-binding protein